MQDRLWAWGGGEGPSGAKEGGDSDGERVETQNQQTIDGFDVGLREGREFKDFLVS